MTQEEKELVIKDLCGRLSYGVKANVSEWNEEKQEEVNTPRLVHSIDADGYLVFKSNGFGLNYYWIENCALLLRPLSSMTEEEKKELRKAHIKDEQLFADCIINHPEMRGKVIPHFAADWCNKNHFNYRLPEHLFITVTETNNPYKT